MSIRQNVTSKLVQEIISLGTGSGSSELTDELLKRMQKDIDISAALELMNESIVSREWMIATDITDLEQQALEIQKRFNNLNMSTILSNMLKATINKNCCQIDIFHTIKILDGKLKQGIAK